MPPHPPPARRWRRFALPAGVAAAAAAFLLPNAAHPAPEALPAPAAAAPTPELAAEVVTPRPGGVDRVCVQPGTVEPFESADLYAKVSGFLAEQAVDIGSAVRKGDVLARLSVPEHEKQAKMDAADVARAESKVAQAEAAVATAEADLGAATAGVALARADQVAKASFRSYRAKQRDRIRQLHAQDAIDAKLMDEQEDQFQSATAAELASREAVNAAGQKVEAARARVAQAKADRTHAVAEVSVARAREEKSAVLLDYAVLRSPYDGVVTRRNFHPGDLVRAADSGGERVPVLAVERTDVMRVVVQVPDRDVPFVNAGDPARVAFDALPGETFRGPGAAAPAVSRSAASEDPRTRTMRTEVDVLNPSGRLRRGMYGLVTLTLSQAAPAASVVPSAALVGRAEGGKGFVRVVRGGRLRQVPVHYGADSGAEVEVLSGLEPGDRVVLRLGGPFEEGANVAATEAKAGGHH